MLQSKLDDLRSMRYWLVDFEVSSSHINIHVELLGVLHIQNGTSIVIICCQLRKSKETDQTSFEPVTKKHDVEGRKKYNVRGL
jgi:hypothetical protein